MPVEVANTVVTGSHDGLWIPQRLPVLAHAVSQSWAQLAVYGVVRRATVHQYCGIIAAGVTFRPSPPVDGLADANPLLVIELEGRILVAE